MSKFTLTLVAGVILSLFLNPVQSQQYEKYKGTQLTREKRNFKEIEETDKLYPELKSQGRRIKNKIDEYPDLPIHEENIVFKAEKQTGNFLNPTKDPSPAPEADFLGLDDSGGSIPPDVNGAAGPEHLMVTLNTDFRVMDRQGNPISTIGSGAFWGSNPGAGSAFDPKIAYDPYANRWILVMPSSSDPNITKLMIAVSENYDPTGNWYMYSFDGDPENQHWFDYPNFGFNKDKLVVTGNLFGNGVYVAVYVFDKQDLYDYAMEVEYTRFKVFDGFTIVPAKTYDTEEEDIYMVHNAGGNSGGYGYVSLKKVTGPPEDPEIENIGLAGVPEPWSNSSYTSGGNFAPQLDIDEKINTVDARMENMVYRNGKLWATHHVYLPAGDNPQRSAVQWWNLSTEGEVLQWGRVDDPTGEMYFAFASIAVNAIEDVLVGFGSFSENQYASASYAMRYATDPPNTMREYYQYKDGQAPYFKTFGASRNRWGDYTSTYVDPVDDLDFWTLQEYAATPAGSQDEWGTWWAYVNLHAVPEAGFSAHITEVPVNSGVNFYDQSKFTPTSWLWTFEGGDPATSTDQNPQNIVYNSAGLFSVTLVATNDQGSNALAVENYINANTSILPEVHFETSDTIPCTGEIVQLTDETIYNANSWLWEIEPALVTFVNGTDATSQNPEVTFDFPFTYSVKLTATNNNGSSSLERAELVNAGGYPLPFAEDFESRSFKTNGWMIENPDEKKTWELTFIPGGPEQGELAAYVNIRNYPGYNERDFLISPLLNFYSHKDIILNFEYAYQQRLATMTDSLFVCISEDCGVTWTRILELYEDNQEIRIFATKEPSSLQFFPQDAEDWCGSEDNPKCISLDLTLYGGKSNIQIMFESCNGFGNNLFLDNIHVDGTIIGIEEPESGSTAFTLYPNPTNGLFKASFPDISGKTTVAVYSMDGTLILSRVVTDPETEQFDLTNVPAGIYLMEVKSTSGSFVEKIVLR